MSRSTVVRSALLLAAVVACAGDPAAPSGGLVPGPYVASLAATGNTPVGAILFTSTQSGISTDWLRSGASIRVTMHADGLTTGSLEMPGINDDGEPESGATWRADLAGNWTLHGTHLRLSHQADTFLRDLDFTLDAGRLVADEVIGDVRIHIVLERQP